jgi:hypothetical protein
MFRDASVGHLHPGIPGSVPYQAIPGLIITPPFSRNKLWSQNSHRLPETWRSWTVYTNTTLRTDHPSTCERMEGRELTYWWQPTRYICEIHWSSTSVQLMSIKSVKSTVTDWLYAARLTKNEVDQLESHLVILKSIRVTPIILNQLESNSFVLNLNQMWSMTNDMTHDIWQKLDTIGLEPMTFRAVIDYSTTELCTVHMQEARYSFFD